jgi:hypothetical protein
VATVDHRATCLIKRAYPMLKAPTQHDMGFWERELLGSLTQDVTVFENLLLPTNASEAESLAALF